MTRVTQLLISILLQGFQLAAYAAIQKPIFPPADAPYSSTFIQPQPPNITAEFRANVMQHKYDVNVNHIFSGYLYLSPSNGKIRLDGADDGILQASLFDFSNATADGLVSNTIFSYTGGLTNPSCSYFYVPPFIILFAPDILRTTGAVYTGVQHDELHGPVSTWVFMLANVVVTMFLDPKDTFVRYDFAAPGSLRTYTTTRFFNISPGPINGTVFETNCH